MYRINTIEIKYVLKDFWFGVYWEGKVHSTEIKNPKRIYHWYKRFYICIVPCFPIIFTIYRERKF